MLRHDSLTQNSSDESLDQKASDKSAQRLTSNYYSPSTAGPFNREDSGFCLENTFYSLAKTPDLGKGSYGFVRTAKTILMPHASKEVAVKTIKLDNMAEFKKTYPLAREKDLQDMNKEHIHSYYKNTLREAAVFSRRYTFCHVFYNQPEQSMRLIMPKLPGQRLLDTTFNNELEFLAALIYIMLEVKYLHGLGYSHGDLNLRNILLYRTQSLQIFLCDFGFSRSLGKAACNLWNDTYYLHPYLATKHPIAKPELDTFSIGQLIYAFIANKIAGPASVKEIIKEKLADVYQGMTNSALKKEKWEAKGYDINLSKIWPLDKAISETIKVYNQLSKDQQSKCGYEKVEEYKISQAPVPPCISSKDKTMKLAPENVLLPLEISVDAESMCDELDLLSPVKKSEPVTISRKPRPKLSIQTNLARTSEEIDTGSFGNSPVFENSIFSKPPSKNIVSTAQSKHAPKTPSL